MQAEAQRFGGSGTMAVAVGDQPDLTWNFSQVFGDRAGEGEIAEGTLALPAPRHVAWGRL